VLYYSEDGKVVGWGPETPTPVLLHSEPGGIQCFTPFKGQKVEWSKHRLLTSPLPNFRDSSPLPEGKTALDVVANYLKQPRKSISNQLQEILGGEFTLEPLEPGDVQYCFTYPAACTETTQSALRTAIVQAGYVEGNNDDDRLRFIPESLASVIFYTKKGLLKLEPKYVVLVINSSSTLCAASRIGSRVQNLAPSLNTLLLWKIPSGQYTIFPFPSHL
jgi:hypothetical protein